MIFYLRKQIGAGLREEKHVGKEVSTMEEERHDETVRGAHRDRRVSRRG